MRSTDASAISLPMGAQGAANDEVMNKIMTTDLRRALTIPMDPPRGNSKDAFGLYQSAQKLISSPVLTVVNAVVLDTQQLGTALLEKFAQHAGAATEITCGQCVLHAGHAHYRDVTSLCKTCCQWHGSQV